MEKFILSYDVGTTGVKTCLYKVGSMLELCGSASAGYELSIMENGGAEQDPDDWWTAMGLTTKKILAEGNFQPENIEGISFCAQMQGVVLVDKDGVPTRKALSYMDYRGAEELKKTMSGFPSVAGVGAGKLLKSLWKTGVVSASAKDPVWKYRWVKTNEPEIFKKTYKWLDVKDYLVSRCTGRFVMTEDSAFATLLLSSNRSQKKFSPSICRMMGVDYSHLPEIINSTDIVGGLSSTAAKDLGLIEGTPVLGGGGDASLIGIGAGASEIGSTHIYLGTSGWVSTVVNRPLLDIKSMIASVIGVDSKTYNYFAELETAGKCLEWVKDHLALDEINVYIEKKQIHESGDSLYRSLFEYMMEAIKDVPAGSNGVLFTPWLHGNRCPFEDKHARGMFFNIGIDSGKSEMIHAVLEGVCFHFKWQLEAQEKKIKTSKVIRLVGGGALSPLTCQILSDILNREVQVIKDPQNAGAAGAAIIGAVGLGLIDGLEGSDKLLSIENYYLPNPQHQKIYEKQFKVFKSLYLRNIKAFKALNQFS